MARLIIKGVYLTLLLTILAVVFNMATRGTAIDDLKEATRKADIEQFSKRINWEDTRAFTLADIISKKEKQPHNIDIGPSLSRAAEIVEFYIQNDNIALLYFFKDKLFPDLSEDRFIWDTGFYGLNGFYVTIGYPLGYIPEGWQQEPPLSRVLRVQVLFELQGLSWRVVGLKVPLFMVPRKTFDIPEEAYDALYDSGHGDIF